MIAGGPGAYFSTLPVKAIVRALRQGGVPASASLTAGTYNCNAIFYGLSHYIATRRRAARRLRARAVPAGNGGRAHPGQPSMALDTLVAGVRLLIATALEVRTDIRVVGGAVPTERGRDEQRDMRTRPRSS